MQVRFLFASHNIYVNTPHTLQNTPTSFSKPKVFSGFTFRESEYKNLSPKYFFLTSTTSAHSKKICLIVIIVLHATQAERFFFSFLFSKQSNTSNENDQYVVCLELSFSLVWRTDNSLSQSFGKIPWSLLDTMTLHPTVPKNSLKCTKLVSTQIRNKTYMHKHLIQNFRRTSPFDNAFVWKKKPNKKPTTATTKP